MFVYIRAIFTRSKIYSPPYIYLSHLRICMAELSPEENRLVEMADCTYLSQNTEAIHQASKTFIDYMVDNYPKSFSRVQELITKKDTVSLNTRKALASLYKASSSQILNILQNQAFMNNQSLSSYKKLLHTVEHAFDNHSIDSDIKYPIELAYINAFVFFTSENHERLVSKSKYYFNTSEDLLALSLLHMYHTSSSPFKHKVQYYPGCLLTLLNYLEKKLNLLYDSSMETTDDFLMKLGKHIEILHEIWTSLNFQRHQSTFVGVMRLTNFVKIMHQLLGNEFPKHLLHFSFDLAEHILSSLTRCQLSLNYPDLMNLFKQLGLREFQLLMNQSCQQDLGADEAKYEIARLKYLIACFDGSFSVQLLKINISMVELFSKLIYPNYKAIQAYMKKHYNNISEITSFIEDLSYQMKSQCLEVLTHKLTMTICQSSKEMLVMIKIMIGSFLFSHLPSLSSGQIKAVEVYYPKAAMTFWQRINTQIYINDQILSILLFTAIGVELFVADMEFQSNLNNFIGTNSNFLWQTDAEITFYTLLLYNNYKDDIFSDRKTSDFKLNLINTALQKKGSNFLSQFSILILEEQFQSKPPYSTVFLTVEYLFQSLVEQFDPKMISVVQVIFKHYQSKIAELKSTELLVSKIYNLLENNIRQGRSSPFISKYFEILHLFLDIQAFSPHFPNLILTIVKLSQVTTPKTSALAEEFLSIMTKGLQILGQLPPNYEQILMQYPWQFQSIEIVNNFTDLVKSTSNSDFINWLLEQQLLPQFSIENSFLINSIIYYQGTKLYPEVVEALLKKIYKYRIVHRVGVNYITGKLNLALLMLIKKNRTQLHLIFSSQIWTNFQLAVHEEFKIKLMFASKQAEKKSSNRQNEDETYLFNNHHNIPFIEAIYHLIYADEHVYCWKYDIEAFLILQLSIMLTQLSEAQQLKYANVSMVAVIKNVLKAQQSRASSQYFQDSDSEEEQMTSLESYDYRQYNNHQKICNKYHILIEFQQNYKILLNKLVSLLKSNASSWQWFSEIVQNVFSREEQFQFHEILNSELCEGDKMRKIVKVNDIKVDRSQFIADSQM